MTFELSEMVGIEIPVGIAGGLRCTAVSDTVRTTNVDWGEVTRTSTGARAGTTGTTTLSALDVAAMAVPESGMLAASCGAVVSTAKRMLEFGSVIAEPRIRAKNDAVMNDDFFINDIILSAAAFDCQKTS